MDSFTEDFSFIGIIIYFKCNEMESTKHWIHYLLFQSKSSACLSENRVKEFKRTISQWVPLANNNTKSQFICLSSGMVYESPIQKCKMLIN